MFPQLKKLNNESGIVLFIVLMVSIIIMIFSAGILVQSINEVNYAQQQTDQIAVDQLAKGLWWNMYSSNMTNVPGSAVSMNISGRIYTMSVTQGATVNGSTSYSVVVNYDSFQ